ncbi:hypothetical protein [Chitinophaga sp. sic0106]|uniref:hypothetical protein n=1 Tax=Chitinophaga sp. sic0106 TaxID=2854785 RepID=UPI001C4377F8|nr:hypothetical protein [Chitinophaga sp. sic0106]MBV7534058.1 hypothetical protein [Chitinophaga sp. sic0106]
MATETQRQQALIDDGFLDNLGTDSGSDLDLTPVEKIFVKWMGQLLLAFQNNLNTLKDGREISASGNLSESIRVEYNFEGNAYEAVFYMADYADYVDKGVRGIGPNNRNNTSPYRFKHAFPSKNMQKALLLWVRQKNIVENNMPQKGLKGRFTRNYLRNKMRAQDLAIRLGVGILRHGTRATNFKQESLDEVMAQMEAEMQKALSNTIVVNIQKDFR